MPRGGPSLRGRRCSPRAGSVGGYQHYDILPCWGTVDLFDLPDDLVQAPGNGHLVAAFDPLPACADALSCGCHVVHQGGCAGTNPCAAHFLCTQTPTSLVVASLTWARFKSLRPILRSRSVRCAAPLLRAHSVPAEVDRAASSWRLASPSTFAHIGRFSLSFARRCGQSMAFAWPCFTARWHEAMRTRARISTCWSRSPTITSRRGSSWPLACTA